MAVNKEEELYSPIKTYYEKQGFTVKSEVLHCDLVAMKPDGSEAVVVEMKKTFNLALLLQGIERLRINDHVVLAVERNRKKSGAHNQRFSDITELCRMLGLGLMTVTFFKTKAPLIEMLCEPGEMPTRGIRRTRQARLLREFRERSGDYNVGGSSGRKLVTAYREKALRAAYAMQQAGIVSPSKLAALTGNPQSALMLRSNYYGWFEKVGRGQYQLTAAGALALAEYAEVIAEWKETFTLPPAPEPKPTKTPKASKTKTSRRTKGKKALPLNDEP